MIAYSIFDDFTDDAVKILENAGIQVTVHKKGVPRPSHEEMKQILEEYDCVIIGTSQKITEDQFENVSEPRIIGTASVGIDHICVPKEKKNLIKVINSPKANAQSVAEYTIGCALLCCKRMAEGADLYKKGLNNKQLYQKPEDLYGKTLGVVGAGNISERIMEYGLMMGMHVICWTKHPEKHSSLKEKGIAFCESLQALADKSDYVSVNLPNLPDTVNLISADFVSHMKKNSVFISVSRLDTIDVAALFEKAKNEPSFYVCLDLDVSEKVRQMIPDIHNVIVTPHIAGGTYETRKRLFSECAAGIADNVIHKSK